MNIPKLFLATLLVSFLLLFSVVISDWLIILIRQNTSTGDSAMYSIKDMLLGIAGETIRALFLCVLFPQLKKAGSSLFFSIQFGLLCSGLIASMWLVIGYGSFVLKNPNAFLLCDALILFIQGILSGIGLHFLYKRKFI
jgi:hypothetical protein